MTDIITLQTDRLLLRQWTPQDRAHFAQLNADPEVMKYYPETLSRDASNEMADKIESLISSQGWGFWALELKQDASFIGFTGLHKPQYELPVTPCVEVGWRLAREHWGKGYATEAGRAALDTAFNTLQLAEVYSFATVTNSPSIAVMQRLHMQDTHRNFEHPVMPSTSPLREHCLYKISHEQWLKQHNKSNKSNNNN